MQVVRNILSIARRFRERGLCPVSDLAQLAVTKQESDWSEQNPGDMGQSFGPYQIYQAVHADTWQLAINPWADYGFSIMYQRWAQAWNNTGGDAQWSDVASRGTFLETFAPQAQGSIAWYAGLGAQRYAEAVEALELVS